MKQFINDIKELTMLAILLLWLGSFLCFLLTVFYDLRYALVSGAIFFVTTAIIHANRDSFKMLEE